MTELEAGTTRKTTDQRRANNTRRALISVLVVLAILLAATTYFLTSIITPVGKVAEPQETNELVWVRSIYGYGDALDQQLQNPNDVAIAPDGTIWITDQTRQRILGFNPDGTYNTMIHQGPRGSSPEAFSFPSALATDEDGNVLIADSMLDKVLVYTPDNEKLGEYNVPDPLCVAIKDDRVVVGSVSGFVIMQRNGEIVKVVGTRGQGDDQFDSVQGVAVTDDDRILIMDQYNNRLSAYDLDGDRLWIREMGSPANTAELQGGGSLSRESTAQAEMILPLRMTLDGTGRLCVVDVFDFSITVLDAANGDLIGKYGAFGDAEGQFTYPVGISYDTSRDWFAVADLYNSRVQIVRIPDSGGSPASPVARTLAGPWRACLIPFVLIVLAVISWLVIRRVRRRRGSLSVDSPPGRGAEIDETSSSTPDASDRLL
ncbi:MAG: NHL repeat-containing protein [Coriobacteriia bacterium]|nr:NHL repeat-containing protein [Coriobacteriia bacterium]